MIALIRSIHVFPEWTYTIYQGLFCCFGFEATQIIIRREEISYGIILGLFIILMDYSYKRSYIFSVALASVTYGLYYSATTTIYSMWNRSIWHLSHAPVMLLIFPSIYYIYRVAKSNNSSLQFGKIVFLVSSAFILLFVIACANLDCEKSKKDANPYTVSVSTEDSI